MNDLTNIAEKLLEIVEQSNSLIMEGFNGDVTREWKNNGHFTGSVVTETDKKVDSFLRTELEKITPEAGFITEETEENSVREYNWIIDPIDGTANFANKIPVFGTIISLWKDSEPLIGLISFPVWNEIILSIKGHGVTINNKKLSLKDKRLENGQPYSIFTALGNEEERIKLLSKLSSILSLPANYYCSAMHAGLAATQRVDLSVIFNLYLWDISAGVAIAKELGVGVEFLSGWPDPAKDDRKNTHQVLIGDQGVVKKARELILES